MPRRSFIIQLKMAVYQKLYFVTRTVGGDVQRRDSRGSAHGVVRTLTTTATPDERTQIAQNPSPPRMMGQSYAKGNEVTVV